MTWNRNLKDTPPPTNQRIKVSDGEIITIARCLLEEDHIIWIFDNVNSKDITIDWWMELPELPPKIVREKNELDIHPELL